MGIEVRVTGGERYLYMYISSLWGHVRGMARRMGIEVRVKGVTGGERDCILFCGVLFLYICMFPLCGDG